MKKFAFAVALITAILTAGHEKLRAYPVTYCTMTCDDCWVAWDPVTDTLDWEADLACSSGQTNECKYSVSIKFFDQATGAWWSTGTTNWMNCNTNLILFGNNLAAPPGLVHGHVYLVSITVRNAYLAEELCYHSITFLY